MSFKSLHPLVTFIYFVFVIAFSMTGHNPIFMGISAFSAFVYTLMLKGRGKHFVYILPLIIMVAVLNPVFSHKGATILFYAGNPITLESILYGLCAALMLFAVIMWFQAFNVIMTSDRIMCVFGRIMPKISLIISMVLRLAPRLKNQLYDIIQGSKMLGCYEEGKGIKSKIKLFGKALYSLMGYILEGSIVTSDAMQARGYGNKGRTSYNIYSFTIRDKAVLSVVLLLSAFIIFGMASGRLRFEFYPLIYVESISRGLIYYISFFLLAFLPVAYDCREAAKWKLLKSKI